MLDGIWRLFLTFVTTEWASQCIFSARRSLVNKSQARPAFLAISKAEQQLKETLWCKTRESWPCNYTWSCLHMSLPQPLSRSLILRMLLGNLVLIPLVNVLINTPLTTASASLLVYLFGSISLPERRMSRRRGLRHPVCLIWRTEISVDSASSREHTLAMPGRERWLGRGSCACDSNGGEEGGEIGEGG